MSKPLSRGFTLLEMLLSIVIFTLLSLTIYQAIIVVSKGSDIVKQRVKQTNKIQIAINILEDSISHAIIPSYSLEGGRLESDFQMGSMLLGSDDFGIYFRCSIYTGHLYLVQSEKVGFRLRDNFLEKLTYNFDENISRVSKILGGVTAFRLRAYHKSHWLAEWDSHSSIPQAIEVTIELEERGMIKRIIPLLNSDNYHG